MKKLLAVVIATVSVNAFAAEPVFQQATPKKPDIFAAEKAKVKEVATAVVNANAAFQDQINADLLALISGQKSLKEWAQEKMETAKEQVRADLDRLAKGQISLVDLYFEKVTQAMHTFGMDWEFASDEFAKAHNIVKVTQINAMLKVFQLNQKCQEAKIQAVAKDFCGKLTQASSVWTAFSMAQGDKVAAQVQAAANYLDSLDAE